MKHSKWGDCCYLFSDVLPLWHPYRSSGRTEALLYNLTDYFCCVLDPKQEEMKHNHFVICEAGEEQTCASGMAGRQWPGLGASFRRSDSYHGAVHSPVNCRIASPVFHFPPGETKMISAERPSEVKKPLSLTNIVGCNFNISVHLQMSAVLIRARHDFPPPSSRVNQESWQQLQGLMWQLPTPSAQNPDISLLSNWERISFKAVWLLSLEKSY